MNKIELEQEQQDKHDFNRTVELLEYGYYRVSDKISRMSLKHYDTLDDYNKDYSYLTDLLRRIREELNFYNRQILFLDLKDSADYYNINSDRVGEKEIKVNKQIESIRNKIKNMKKY